MTTKNDRERIDPKAVVERWLEEKAQSGEIGRVAERRGISYGDALIELAEELYRPFAQIEEKYAKRRRERARQVDEADLDRRARAHAERHGVDYATALDVVLAGGARRVELEARSAPEPPPVDEADAALNRRAEEHARRKGCSYEAALDAVLAGEERA